MAQFVSIEGNIGVGKSTFVKLLLEQIKDSDVVNEPVEQWLKIKDSDGKNILGEFYEDKKRIVLLVVELQHQNQKERVNHSK